MYRKIVFRACETLQWCFLILIRGYQKIISPFLGNHCRFHPSCSQYALEAMKTYSTLKALYMIARRLMRCNPLHPGGFDPISESQVSGNIK
jgi:putative membrane protein insertion efficiency factor